MERSFGNPVIDLITVHAKSTGIVENQAAEPEGAAWGERVGVEEPRGVPHVNLDLVWVLQECRLRGLHGKRRKEVIRGKSDSVDREAACAGNRSNSSIDGLGPQSNCSGMNI